MTTKDPSDPTSGESVDKRAVVDARLAEGDPVTRAKLQGLMRRNTAIETIARAAAEETPEPRAEPPEKPYFLNTEQYQLARRLAGAEDPAANGERAQAARGVEDGARVRAVESGEAMRPLPSRPTEEPEQLTASAPRGSPAVWIASVAAALVCAVLFWLVTRGDDRGPGGETASASSSAGATSSAVASAGSPSPGHSGTEISTAAPVGSTSEPPLSSSAMAPSARAKATAPPSASMPPPTPSAAPKGISTVGPVPD